jgi:hypothetical protein
MDSSQHPKWTYLESYLYFKQQNTKAAQRQIHANQNSLKCKPDYYLGSKMLELMILFDQNDQDWLEYKIENFRKLISRYKANTSTRIHHAFHLLLKLHKSLFKPEALDLIQNPDFFTLQNEPEGLEWKPDTFELIRYDSWIYATVKRQNS